MKKIILILPVIFIAYIILINFIASLVQNSSNQVISEEQNIIDSSNVKLNFGDSVGVSVKRPRFYGIIYENEDFSYIHLFELFYIPKKIKNINFMWIHLIFLISFSLLSLKISTKKEV